MSKHLCHAEGCTVAVPPSLLMCDDHWRLVPRNLQRALWRVYRPGQEIDKRPSPQYMDAQRACVEAVAKAEGRRGESS